MKVDGIKEIYKCKKDYFIFWLMDCIAMFVSFITLSSSLILARLVITNYASKDLIMFLRGLSIGTMNLFNILLIIFTSSFIISLLYLAFFYLYKIPVVNLDYFKKE